jgi:hypothetical protein
MWYEQFQKVAVLTGKCDICGKYHNGGCDPIVLDKIEQARKKREYRLEVSGYQGTKLTFVDRLAQGFAMMDDSYEP